MRAQQLASTPAVTVRSFMKVGDSFVPVEEFEGPIVNRDYILGSIEMTAGRKTLISRDVFDDINWLWPFVLQALEEVIAGRVGSRSYPDMPLEIVFRPHRDRVAIQFGSGPEVSVMRDELCRALISAATVFYDRLRRFGLASDDDLRGLAELSERAARG